MLPTMLMFIIVVSLLFHTSLAEETCEEYTAFMKPLLDSGDIGKLRDAFELMNKEMNVVTPYAMFAVEATAVLDTNYLKMLVSLSKPFVDKMNASDVWPENNNAPMPFIGKVCEKDVRGELVCSDVAAEFNKAFNSSNTFHAGIRYVYNCRTLQTKTCFKKNCTYDPDSPVVRSDNKEIYVPLDNFIAADGSAMSGHIAEGVNVYFIEGFTKMAVRQCFARQLFYSPSEGGCFTKSKFFSLAEVVGLGGNSRDRDGVAPWYDFMMAKPDYFVLMS